MTTVRTTDYYKAVVSEIKSCGGRVIEFDNGNKHAKLKFSIEDKTFVISIPCSPASYHAKENGRFQVRNIVKTKLPDFEFKNKDTGSKVSKKKIVKKEKEIPTVEPVKTRLSENPFEKLADLDIYKETYHGRKSAIRGDQ